MDGSSKGRAEKYRSEMTEQFGSEEEEHMKNSSQSIEENGNSSHIAFSSIK